MDVARRVGAATISARGRPVARAIKRGGDVVGAALLLGLTAPLWLTIMLMLRVGYGPGVLYAHRRIGQAGKSFTLFKFRTMHRAADSVLAAHMAQSPEAATEWATHRKLRQDPRVHRAGRFLRRSSLDELPQLLNVLMGDMSLVGPRPIVEDEVPLFGDAIVSYRAVRPGITGLWQVSGRNDTNYDDRVALDATYVRHWTLRRDLTILLRTVPAVLRGKGAY